MSEDSSTYDVGDADSGRDALTTNSGEFTTNDEFSGVVR